MELNCGGCNLVVKGQDKVACSTCGKYYHTGCAFIQPGRTRAAKGRWECTVCIARRPRNNSDNSPARSSRNTSPPHSRQGSPAIADTGTVDPITPEELAMLTADLRNFQDTFKQMKTNMERFHTALDSCKGKVESATSTLEAMQNRFTELEERDRRRDSEIATLRKRVDDLEKQKDERDQAALRRDIEVHGINEVAGENLGHIVSVLANKIGFELHQTDVDSVSRAGPRAAPGGEERRRPRPLVVSFTRQAPRDEFLKAARVRRGLKGEDLSVAGPPQRLYIGERLTRANRLLLKKTKELSSKHGFRFCWFRGGKILLRRRDGDRAEVVWSENDLFRLFGDVCASPVEVRKD